MGSGITIENVEPGSNAAELEIEAGDRLLALTEKEALDSAREIICNPDEIK